MKYICNGCDDAPPCKLNAGGADIAPDCCPFGDGTSKWEKRKPKAKKPDEPCQHPGQSLTFDGTSLTCHAYGKTTVLYPDGQWSEWHKPEETMEAERGR